MVGLLTVHLRLPGCASLKEKRGRLQPLLARVRREFNVSAAEVGLQNAHQEAIIACATVNSDRRHLESSLQAVAHWIKANWPDGDIIRDKVELI
jgi:uncharacterized protein YlxP (DUF503 family)